MATTVLKVSRSRNSNGSRDEDWCLQYAMGAVGTIHPKGIDTGPPDLPSWNFVVLAKYD